MYNPKENFSFYHEIVEFLCGKFLPQILKGINTSDRRCSDEQLPLGKNYAQKGSQRWGEDNKMMMEQEELFILRCLVLA